MMKFKTFLFTSFIILILFLFGLFIWLNYINIAYIQINVVPEESQINLGNLIIPPNTKTRIKPGTYNLKISKENYLTIEETLTIKRKQFLSLSYILSKKVSLISIQNLNNFKGFKPLWLNNDTLISVDPQNNSFVTYDLTSNKLSFLSENFTEPISNFLINSERGLIFFVTGFGDSQKYYYFWIYLKKIEEVDLNRFSSLSNFSFSPDGDLSFTAIEKNLTKFSELYIYNKTSNSAKSVSSGKFIQAVKITWINNNQVLIYKEEDTPNSGFLSIFDLIIQTLTPITQEKNYTTRNFSLSPDKKQLLLQDENGINIVNLSNLKTTKLNVKIPSEVLNLPLIWLDDNNILLMNSNFQLISYNLLNQGIKVLTKETPTLKQIIDFILSPDRSKLLLMMYGGQYLLADISSFTNL